MSAAPDLERLQQWVGRSESLEDRCDAVRVRQLAASFDLDPAPWRDGAELPPLWHWIFTTPVTPLGETGPDGHAARGGFLPRLGEPLRRDARVASVELKQGRSGTLVFVKVVHALRSGATPLIDEEQDIVYRGAPPAAAARPNPPARPPVWRDTLEAAAARTPAACALVPDDVLLFRYSALTFNSHRIHYDRRHCLESEGYPGLVVHGPLLATCMATLAWLQSGRRPPRGFSFRAQAPVFDGEAISVRSERAGALARTAVLKADGGAAMSGEMSWD